MKKQRCITAPKKNGGGIANINSCTFNKHCALRQFSTSNPPLLLAANRYAQLLEKVIASGLGEIDKFRNLTSNTIHEGRRQTKDDVKSKFNFKN